VSPSPVTASIRNPRKGAGCGISLHRPLDADRARGERVVGLLLFRGDEVAHAGSHHLLALHAVADYEELHHKRRFSQADEHAKFDGYWHETRTAVLK
jgi:hypothetical protein